MFDINNREIKTGDFVTVSGAYFKTSNGAFFVSSESDATGLYLRRVKKNGQPCMDSATSTQSWPLSSYCSDRWKNIEAKEHNAEHAKIEVVDGMNTWYVAEYFRNKAQEYRESAERYVRNYGADSYDAARCQQSAADCQAVAQRLSATAEQPKAKEPEQGIKFYWNGIKVNGGRLIPCYYCIIENADGNESISISTKDYHGLPHEYFTVKNNSDPYTDYFDNDRTTLTTEHPLYKYARYAAWKDRVRGNEKYIESLRSQLKGREPWAGHFDSIRKDIAKREQWIAEFARMKDPGQPTACDLKAVADMKTAAESARLAAEHAAELAAREECLRKHSEGRHYIESVAEQYPVVTGQPTVEIGFSESPYLYGLSHGANNVFSVAAAEIIFKHFDDMYPKNSGYDKTDFTIRYTDPDTGEENTYQGRYDIGDHDGGLIAHIRAFGENSRFRTDEEKSDICVLADYLERFTAHGQIVSVELAPGVVDFMSYKKRMEQQKREQVEKDWADLFAMVGMLTDEQLESAIMCVDPNDEQRVDVARFFFQELNSRDTTKAVEVFKKWKGLGA